MSGSTEEPEPLDLRKLVQLSIFLDNFKIHPFPENLDPDVKKKMEEKYRYAQMGLSQVRFDIQQLLYTWFESVGRFLEDAGKSEQEEEERAMYDSAFKEMLSGMGIEFNDASTEENP